MREKEKLDDRERSDSKQNSVARVPVMDLRMMADDEWNALAYRNWLERRCHA